MLRVLSNTKDFQRMFRNCFDLHFSNPHVHACNLDALCLFSLNGMRRQSVNHAIDILMRFA